MSAISVTSSPESRRILALPPVDNKMIPRPANAVANATRPVLSDTESRARRIGESWVIV